MAAASAPGDSGRPLTCIEIGGSGAQTVSFDGDAVRVTAGIDAPATARLALAVPGLVEDGHVVGASTLGWYDVDPVVMLRLPRRPELVCNDAEAAALGEWVLRGRRPEGLAYVGLGTGVGGAVVGVGRSTESNLFGHQEGFSDEPCTCGRVGCLETVAAGWALPAALNADRLSAIGAAIATAIDREVAAKGVGLVVVTGGLVASHPGLLAIVGDALTGRTVVGTARPPRAKSAAAWGLRDLLHRRGEGGQGPVRVGAPVRCIETLAGDELVAEADGQQPAGARFADEPGV